MIDFLFLGIASAFASALNAVAGGGTFVLFPALLSLGVPAISANATCSVSICAGSFASSFAYRNEVIQSKSLLLYFCILTFIGGGVGALLLVNLSNRQFEFMIPWLLLIAALVFTGRDYLQKITKSISVFNSDPKHGQAFLKIAFCGLLQFFIAIYGGFFGAGMGFMMLAMLQVFGMQDTHQMNAFRSILGVFVNLTAITVFIFSGLIYWNHVLIMILCCIVGGYWGSRLALKFPADYIRKLVIAIAWFMTILYFYKFYGSIFYAR